MYFPQFATHNALTIARFLKMPPIIISGFDFNVYMAWCGLYLLSPRIVQSLPRITPIACTAIFWLILFDVAWKMDSNTSFVTNKQYCISTETLATRSKCVSHHPNPHFFSPTNTTLRSSALIPGIHSLCRCSHHCLLPFCSSQPAHATSIIKENRQEHESFNQLLADTQELLGTVIL